MDTYLGSIWFFQKGLTKVGGPTLNVGGTVDGQWSQTEQKEESVLSSHVVSVS